MVEYLSLEEGIFLVRLARRTIEHELGIGDRPEVNASELSDRLRESRGVFTSLYKINDGKELRGCIGYPYPIKPLYLAVMDTARESAFNDPRFPPLSRDEINSIIIELSILTPMEKIEYNNPLELPKMIIIGRDGLMLKYGLYSGLLLPQVPVEYNWSPEEYLIHLSMKAGLPADGYLYEGVEIYRFEVQIFSEESPNGVIVEKDISSCSV